VPGRSQQQTGLFPNFAYGRDLQRMCAFCGHAFCQARCAHWPDLSCEGHLRVSEVHSATWKDEFTGHEYRFRAALPHQDLRTRSAIAHQNYRGGIADRYEGRQALHCDRLLLTMVAV
jgi:hypothetical protein